MVEEGHAKPRDGIFGLSWPFKALLWLFCAVGLFWLGYVFYCPLEKVTDKDELAALDNALAAVIVRVNAQLPDAAEIRLEPRGGNNLTIYLRKNSFESVPYPDRGEFVKVIGKAWCDDPGINGLWLPSVTIRDIRTGEELASFNCVLRW